MKSHQILLVEDDAVLRLSVSEFMRGQGMRVIEADDALAATTFIEAGGYISGLVSDIDLGPGEDGFEVARRIRSAYPGLPVVLVSGSAAARHRAEGVAGSVFLEKPYHPRRIVEALATLTKGAQTAGPASRAASCDYRMLSSAECIERAMGFEGRSFACNDESLREELASMGRTWRYVASLARWQDAFALRQASI